MKSVVRGSLSDNSEIRCHVKSYSFSDDTAARSVALGKIVIYKDNFSEPHEASIVCFESVKSLTQALPYLCSPCVCAILISGQEEIPDAMTSELLPSLPFLFVSDSSPDLIRYSGKIALVDTAHELLIINPELDILNKYTSLGCSMVPHGLTISPFYCENLNVFSSSLGLCVAPTRDITASSFFDTLLRLSENSRFTKTSVILAVPNNGIDALSFCEQSEALMCASLYGNFSLILSDYLSVSDITNALSLLKNVFCTLEASGKEFNGYIQKGISISAPIWLKKAPALCRPDIVCFELDLLSERLLGINLTEFIGRADSGEILRTELFSCIEEYISKYPHIPFCAKTSSDRMRRICEELLGIPVYLAENRFLFEHPPTKNTSLRSK